MYISLGFLASLQPTFYPIEAEKRGARPVEYGLVFAINSLGQVFFSPFAGKFAVKLGVKESLCVGAMFEGLCGFLFAFLGYSQDVSYFIGFSCIHRLMEGIAGTFRASTGIAILMALNPDRVHLSLS